MKKNKLFALWTPVAVLLFCIIYIMTIKEPSREYTVLEKFGKTQSRYKSYDIYTEYILVLKTENGDIIDIKTNPSTFYKAKRMGKLWFSLDYRDCKVDTGSWILNNKYGVWFSLVIALVIYILFATNATINIIE